MSQSHRSGSGYCRSSGPARFPDRPSQDQPTTCQSRRSTAQPSSKSPPGLARKARSRLCQDTVILRVPPTSNCRRRCRQHDIAGTRNIVLVPCRCEMPCPDETFTLSRLLRRIRGELRHNSELLGNGTALYGRRGTRPKSANAGPQGTPGHHSHVIYIAMSSITTSIIVTPSRRSVERTCDDLAIVVLVAVGLIASLTFRDYGLGWDDYTHAEYADLLLRMYGSGFRDTGALSFANLYMYGGGFDMAAALLHRVIPLELFETRRLLGAIVGLVGLAVTWRLGRRVGGPLAGLAALLLLALCPTFYGHMFMNPKDAPFAVAMVILMLGLVRLAEEYPHPSPRTVLIVGLGAGLSIGSRILGGLALLYALIGFVPILIEEVRTHGSRETARRFVRMAYALLPGLVLGYLVMGLIWPWSIIEPDHPFLAATYFSHFFEKPWKEMFDGAIFSVPDMPWSYLPTLFALQLPEVLLALTIAGVIGSILALPRRDVPARRKTILLMLTLAAVLPIAIAIVKRPALYNGIRHFIFVIPPMTVLAGLAFARGMSWLKENRRSWQPAALAVFSFGLLLPLGEMIRLHP